MNGLLSAFILGLSVTISMTICYTYDRLLVFTVWIITCSVMAVAHYFGIKLKRETTLTYINHTQGMILFPTEQLAYFKSDTNQNPGPVNATICLKNGDQLSFIVNHRDYNEIVETIKTGYTG